MFKKENLTKKKETLEAKYMLLMCRFNVCEQYCIHRVHLCSFSMGHNLNYKMMMPFK